MPVAGYGSAVRKLLALVFAVLSGGYLLFGWIPDPLPFVDEGLALVVFLNCLAALGVDLRGWLGMEKGRKRQEGRTIDID